MCQEEVKEPDDVLVVGQDVAEPGDKPGQGEDGSNFTPVQKVVQSLALALELEHRRIRDVIYLFYVTADDMLYSARKGGVKTSMHYQLGRNFTTLFYSLKYSPPL